MSEQEVFNEAISQAIKRIETLDGNEIYRRAWKRAALALKDMLVEFNTSITDKAEQISST